jgi:hypothetical protein
VAIGQDDREEVMALDHRIEALFAKLDRACADAGSGGGASGPTARHNAQKLADLRADFTRARRRVQEAWSKADLLKGSSKFRFDFSSFHSFSCLLVSPLDMS